MAALSHSESRRKYSWWWDSHISPKNSKWLQENLTDMDSKVKSMIKLIEEDADSFARRAEMYYKKRPELMKLVEEFYRAYRALAERYNYATCELRHAHQTIEAFPEHQVSFELAEDSPSRPPIHSRDPRTPETKFPVRALFKDDDELLDELPESIEKEGSIKLHEMPNDKGEVSQDSECEVRALEKALSDMRAEKEDVLLNYQQCLAKLSNMEGELSNVQMDSKKLDEEAGRAEIEVWTMKEALVQLEVENKDGSVKYEECLEKISNLEAMLFQIQDNAESDGRALKDEIIKLEFEKEEMLCHRNECLGKISVLENVVSVSEKEASLLKKNAKLAENEVSELKKAAADLFREKEASVKQYKCCLEKISNLEREINIAKEDVKRLNNDLMIENLKFKNAEKNYSLLEMTNLSLQTEAENLLKKIANKDRELTEKQEELENLMTRLVDEHSHHSQIEASLNSLQNLYSRSQDEQIALMAELESVVQNLKDSEANKEILEEEIRQVRDENRSMVELNVSCANSMENIQNEILGLREIKERLEKEVSNHVGLSDTLHQEITLLKDEIKVLNGSYQAMVEQVEAAGLSLKCFGPSIKSMKNENKLLVKRLENVESLLEEKTISENCMLASSQEEVKAMHESCRFLEGEKATLAAEKASLLSQLETITETMQKLLEKNAVLENSFSAAKVELGGLREKSKGLEEICELLRSERSFLLTERGELASKLENVERRLKIMEKRYNGLERKCADLEKEKISATSQVEELKVCLSAEKEEQTSSKLQSDSKLAGLEKKIHFLQEENSWKNKEFEEELERSLKSQFELTILQKFMKEMEEKNWSLVIECQKHVEASKLAEKLILGLESESLEQQVESKIMLDEIEWLRLGVYRIFKALEIDLGCEEEDKIENERAFENRVLENIDDLKCSISKHEDDKQGLLVENSLLLTLLEQLELKGMEIVSEKGLLEKNIKAMGDKLEMAEKEKVELSESNRKLKKEVNLRNQNFAVLEAEMENLRKKEIGLCKEFYALEEAYALANRDKEDLTKKFLDLEEEKYYLLDQLNDSAIMEHIATASQSEILRVFSEEKIAELHLLIKDLKRQIDVNSVLECKMRVFMEKFELQESENLLLKDCGNKLEREIEGMRGYNLETEERLLDTQAKLEASENLNLKLCKTVDELETDIQESVRVKDNLEEHISQLSGSNAAQNLEIESLHMVKTGLESELDQLREEIEDKIIRERILSFELEEKNKEFGLWEASASAFYFDLQISAIDGILCRDKLQELADVRRDLEDENDLKNLEIEGMKVRICSMESEISDLKSQLCSYGPVVDALRFDVSVLEHNAVLQSKLKSSRNHDDPEVSEAAADPNRSSSEILPEDDSLISLQDLHMRIKVLGKLMQEMNKPTLHRRSSSKKYREEHAIAADIGKPVRCLGRDKIKTKHSESRNPTMLMKDIPLDQISNTNTALPKRIRRRGSNNNSRAEGDQMLELWEKAAESSSCELTIGKSLKLSSFNMAEKDIIVYDPRSINSDPPSADSDIERELGVDKIDFLPRKSTENQRRILDRLNSDAAKLENLHTTARIIREKMEATNSKKSQNSKKDEELETVWEQFLEAEETIEYLVDLNGQLVRSIESCPSPDRKFSGSQKEAVRIRRRKVSEQARKGSERIGRLQLELQKIQYVLVKMEEKSKGKSKFFRSKTVVLSDFMYNGKKNSGKRKKGPMCGCFRRPSSRSGSS